MPNIDRGQCLVEAVLDPLLAGEFRCRGNLQTELRLLGECRDACSYVLRQALGLDECLSEGLARFQCRKRRFAVDSGDRSDRIGSIDNDSGVARYDGPGKIAAPGK